MKRRDLFKALAGAVAGLLVPWKKSPASEADQSVLSAMKKLARNPDLIVFDRTLPPRNVNCRCVTTWAHHIGPIEFYDGPEIKTPLLCGEMDFPKINVTVMQND